MISLLIATSSNKMPTLFFVFITTLTHALLSQYWLYAGNANVQLSQIGY